LKPHHSFVYTLYYTGIQASWAATRCSHRILW